MRKALSVEAIKKKLLSRKIAMTSGCWLYNGVRSGVFDYGQIYWRGKLWRAHRLSMFLFKPEEYSSSLQVNHKCDNPACFNPEHLYAGTQGDNRNDAIKRGHWQNQYKDIRFCSKGHEYTSENTYISPGSGWRACRICKNNAMILRRALGARS